MSCTFVSVLCPPSLGFGFPLGHVQWFKRNFVPHEVYVYLNDMSIDCNIRFSMCVCGFININIYIYIYVYDVLS